MRWEGASMRASGLTPLGQVPQGWLTSSLRDLAEDISRGITPHYVDRSPYSVVNQKSIRWGRLDPAALKYLDPEQASSVPPEKFVRENDVVLNSTGDITLGRAYVFTEPVANHVTDSHVTTIRLRPKSLHPGLLVQLLEMTAYQREIYAVTSGSTGQLELSRDAVRGLIFPVPPPGASRSGSLRSSRPWTPLSAALRP
jgi:type I restriction enzyme S subunit